MRSAFSWRMTGLALCLAVGFGALATVALYQLNIIRIDAQLRSVAGDAVGRVERTLDLAIIAMQEQAASGGFDCGEAGRVAMRDAFYAVGNIKDLRYNLAGQSCWAWADGEQLLRGVVECAKFLPALNPDYQVAAVVMPTSRSLALRWKPDESSEVLAILSTSHLLFDALPGDLRDQVEAKLTLGDGSIFTEYAPPDEASLALVDKTRFEIASERFPITLSIALGKSAYWASFRSMPIEAAGSVAVFSLLFGVFAAKGMGGRQRPEDELRRAILRGEVKPFFQPLFDLETRALLGFEMLARWIRPDGKMVSPSVFIPIAENGGLIDILLTSLLRQAGHDLGDMLRSKPDLKLGFNVTPDQLLAPGFRERLLAEAVRFGLPIHSLVVEITERQALGDLEQASAVARGLADAGVRLAIDDAGTGHNGLSSMHALNAHIIKIDKYFVDSVIFNRKSRAMIEMLVSFASEFGMEVVAEGIETEEQLSVLLTLGIRQGQGYLYGKPMPASDCIQIIEPTTGRRADAPGARAVREKVKASS